MEPPPPQTVAVGSTNRVKVDAARAAFARAFPSAAFTFAGYAADSGVSAQPMGDAETRAGALNRARAAAAAHAAAAGGSRARFAVGLEGGCGEEFGVLSCFAWMCVLGPSGEESFSRTGTFALPPAVAALVRAGVELGEADDRVFGRVGSKAQDGAVGLLTKGAITRTAYYEHALVLALAPYISAEHYGGTTVDQKHTAIKN